MRGPRFPLTVEHGPASVKVYRVKASSTAEGFAYQVIWKEPGNGRKVLTKADLTEAKDEAKIKAQQLATGITGASVMGAADLQTYAKAKGLVEKSGVPLIAALEEWSAAREKVGASILEACEAFVKNRATVLERVKLADAIDKFIETKERAGKQGERTYRNKLNPLLTFSGDVYLDTITTHQFTAYLESFGDAVTRNDQRKRVVTLCRWAQKGGYLASDAKLAIEQTERAMEKATPIGIIPPKIFGEVLEFIRKEHPHYLAAVVLAGFCGLRASEVHGKMPKAGAPRADMPRQKWADIDLARRHLNVSVAKTNTPSHRLVPICPAAVAWLRLDKDREGFVCAAGALERVREICIQNGFELPDNCLRHSFITYEIAMTGDKQKTATISGNSVTQIDRHYRVPQTASVGRKWFAVKPS